MLTIYIVPSPSGVIGKCIWSNANNLPKLIMEVFGSSGHFTVDGEICIVQPCGTC